MKKQISYKIVSLVFSVLVVCFAIAFYVVAWDEPTDSPPDGDIPAPLNTGDITQYKSGALGIGGLFETDSETHLAILGGNVGIGIGMTSPAANLDIEGSIYTTGGSGDVTGNGTISALDAARVAQYLAGIDTLTREKYARADVDGDGRVTPDDEFIIAAMAVGFDKADSIREIHSVYGARSSPRVFLVDGSVGIGAMNIIPDEKFEIEWVPDGTDVEIGRGINDIDVTFLTLRSPNGTKWYLYPADDGTLVLTEIKP